MNNLVLTVLKYIVTTAIRAIVYIILILSRNIRDLQVKKIPQQLGAPNGIADTCVIFSRVDAERVPTLADDSHQQYLEFFVPAPVDFYQQ
jgi:hypothetical protein